MIEEIGKNRGFIFDIQRYSLHDGPGLRTNVFFKGCGLNCHWCSNPEAKKPLPEIAFFEKSCFVCGDCIPACPDAAISMGERSVVWDKLKCSQCARCAEACLSHAFSLIGKEITANEVVAEVLRDRAFYGDQGGLTLTGGEPALQPDFAEAVLRLAKEEGLHTAIETCGAVSWRSLERLLPFLNLVLFDIKHIDPEVHRQFTGASNVLILDNLRRAVQAGANLVVRVPLIPGFNADRGSLTQIARFVQSLQNVREINLLAYHTLGRAKYRALQIPYELEQYPPMKLEEAEGWAAVLREFGFSVLVGG